MNKELRSLYDKCLKDKWLPLLKEWKKTHDKAILYEMGLGWRCAFCHECNEYCKRCKINPEICNTGGAFGYYGLTSIQINFTEKYLKEMIKRLKREKFKCLFKLTIKSMDKNGKN